MENNASSERITNLITGYEMALDWNRHLLKNHFISHEDAENNWARIILQFHHHESVLKYASLERLARKFPDEFQKWLVIRRLKGE